MNDDGRRQRPHAGPLRGAGMSRMFLPCRLRLRETIQLVCARVRVCVSSCRKYETSLLLHILEFKEDQ